MSAPSFNAPPVTSPVTAALTGKPSPPRFVLPSTEKREPLQIEPINLLMVGTRKIGKTELCSVLPDALHLDLEESTLYVKCSRQPVPDVKTFKEVMAEFRRGEHGFKFLIVDVIDKLDEWADPLAVETYKNRPMGKNFTGLTVAEIPGSGQSSPGWAYHREEFFKLFYEAAGGTRWKTVWVGHLREKFVRDNMPMAVEPYELGLTGKLKELVCERCDPCYLFRDSNAVLNLTFVTKSTLICGSRAKYLAGKTFKFHNPATLEDWAQIYPVTVGAVLKAQGGGK